MPRGPAVKGRYDDMSHDTSMMANDTAQRDPRRVGWVLLGGVGLVTLALTGYGWATAAQRFLDTGDAFPGTVTSVAEIVGHFAGTLAGALCLGALVFIVTTAAPDKDGRIEPAAFRVHLLVERAALAWAAFAIAMIAIDAASGAGVPLGRLLGSGLIGDAIAASESARGWCAAALCAVVVAVGIRCTLRWVGHVLLLLPAVLGVVAVPVTGNAGQGPDHDFATSAVIVAAVALAVLTGVHVAAALSLRDGAPRHLTQWLSVSAGGVALLYAAMLAALMIRGVPVFDSPYGRLAVVAGVLLVAVVVVDAVTLAKARVSSPALATCTALAAVAVLGASSAMAVQAPPRFLTHQFTAWDVFLGYELPGPPTAVNLLTAWRFDPLLGTGAAVLAVGYLVGVAVLRRRGDRWPVGRTVAWTAGCAGLLVVTSSGVRSYGSAMFSVHMAEHMTLNMFIPVLLVLGAPVTLALRVLPAATDGRPPGPREWVLWLVHSPATRLLAHPMTAFVLFVGSLYAVYFTPLFDTLVRYHWGHEFMSVHFLLTGYLFFWGIIGIDPGPRRLPFLGRLGLLFAVMPFHAFFGIATMTMTSVLAENFYRSVDLPWVQSLSDDQHLGGAIAWGSSELPVIIVVVALVAQWARQDRRAGARHDRHSDAGYDDDLDAYNAMLRELARNRS